MKLSRLLSSSLCITLAACFDATSPTSSTDGIEHRTPPTVDLRATSVDSGGVLTITAIVANRSGIHLKVVNAPECPFALRIFPDATGEFMVATGVMCPSTASTTDLAPNDSLVLSRTLSAFDLMQYQPGTYGINVTVGTTTALVTAWGGAVKFPLSSVAPLPPGDGPLTGTWIEPSIDNWIQLDLSQSGTRVVGYYRTGSANFGGFLSYPTPISGTTTLPQAMLEWSDGGQVTMNATLSVDGDSLTGTWSVAGQPAIPFRGFHRSK